MNRSRKLVAAGLLVGLAAACSQGPDSDPPVGAPGSIAVSVSPEPTTAGSGGFGGPDGPVACDLLSADEIASVLAAPTSSLGGPVLLCDWETERDDIFSIRLKVENSHARTVFESAKEAQADQPLPGVGDDAFISGLGGVNVDVLVGSVTFFFQIVPDCGGLGAEPCSDRLLAELKDAAVALARLVATRL
jgi:hypothetical protein